MINAPLLLAQAEPIEEAAPPPVSPGTEAPVELQPNETPPGGTGALGGDGATGLFGGGGFFWILILALVVMMVMTTLGQRRERKKRQAMIEALKKGDRVQTVGGILGSVVEVRDSEVVVKVDENSNTRLRFARSAVQSVVEEKSE